MATRGRYLLGWLLALAVLGSAFGSGSDKAARINELVGRYAAMNQFNGSILVAEGGQVIFKKGYGPADEEWQIPNAPDTRFRIGSVTKQFTALLILQLVEQGKLSLDARLSDVLPYYRKDTGATITLHHLLNHTSGLPNYTSQPDFTDKVSRNPYGVEEFVKACCSGDLEFEPGTKFNYSNSGYFILGAVIEQVTGKTYARQLQEKILDPLGLQGTGYDDTATVLPKRAAGYQRRSSKLVNARYLDMSIPYAAGSMYSTVEDLYRWDQALYTDRLLGDELKAKMFTPGLSDYGYGWGIRTLPVGPGQAKRTVIAHGGGINGFTSLIRRVVDDRNLVVLLDNTGSSHLNAISDGILDILYGRTPPGPKRSVAEELDRIIREKGIEPAIARYHEIKAKEAAAFDLREPELNALGYRLLAEQKAEAALAVFQLNLEAYPESGNAYDSLAEAYAALGKKEEAIRNYAKSLQLNPANRNAVEQLNKLLK